MIEHIVNTLEETNAVAKELASTFKGGDIVLLRGNLGAGKTAMTKMIATELGVQDEVTSPTFAIMNMYPLPKANNGIETLIHVDTYRMESEEDLLNIGLQDYLDEQNTLTIIEWPEKMQAMLEGKQMIDIEMVLQEDNSRKITIN